jgi:biotin synthase
MIRLTAGRMERSFEEQALCFFAGANSIFCGEKLITTPNPSYRDDDTLFALFGFKKRAPFKSERNTESIHP